MMGTPRGPSELVLLPLGGVGEIGMNCYLYGVGDGRSRKWIMVDLGVKFGDDRDPGIDLILPDVSFAEHHRRHLLGIVLTHAHEDHIGALPWLWRRLQAPVYCTPFTAALVETKLEEAGLTGQLPLRVLPMGARWQLGPFDLEYVAVAHSIPEPNALVIRTEAGTALHTGDWKIDHAPSIPPRIDETRLRAIGAEGVDALICDSTNVLRPGRSPSEHQIGDVIGTMIAASKSRVGVTTFASHVGRIDTVARAARGEGREVVVAGRAMHRVIDAARKVGLLTEHTFQGDDAFGYLPRDKVVLLCTGSQGEPRAALARIAEGSHPEIVLEEGDLVIFSSRAIPGNEKAIAAVINGLAAQGVEVVTADDALVHTSGHPRQDEIRSLYDWLKPRLLVPMHGEMRHLMRHLSFAKECGVSEAVLAPDGRMLRLAPGPAEIVGDIESGVVHVDGRLMVSGREGPARHRRKLSFSGIAVVSVAIDTRGEIIGNPELVLDGIPEEDMEGIAMRERLLDAIDQALGAMPRARRRDDAAVQELLRGAVRKAADGAWGKKPVCHVVIHRL
jgi:ribonuclease J